MQTPSLRTAVGGAGVLALALVYHFTELDPIPPGLDTDAASNGWLALNWLRNGVVPFWIHHAGAPEPLIVWLQTLTTWLLGPSVFALRSVSASFLALAAPMTYLLALEIGRDLPRRNWTALFAGLIFACNPVITQLARTGLRASTLPLLSVLFFWAFLVAWRNNRLSAYLACGLLLGLCAYTYLAARFLPLVLLAFLAVAWLTATTASTRAAPQGPIVVARRSRTVRVLGIAVLVAAALITALPQLLFFATYPAAFWARAQDVTLLQNPLLRETGLTAVVLQKLLGLWLMLGLDWSGQYNQAMRPLLAPLPFAGLLCAALPLWRYRQNIGIQWLMLAATIMLLPDLIGGDRVQPHELRAIGAYAPIIILSGLGLAYCLDRFHRLRSHPRFPRLAGSLIASVIVVWAFVDWHGWIAPGLRASEFNWYGRDDVAFAHAVIAAEGPILVPLSEFSRPAVTYLTAARAPTLRSAVNADRTITQPNSEQITLLLPRSLDRPRTEASGYRYDPASLVLVTGDTAYLMPPPGTPIADPVDDCLQRTDILAYPQPAGLACELPYARFAFPTRLVLRPWSLSTIFDDRLVLLGVVADTTTVSAHQILGVTVYWLAEHPAQRGWRYFVQLLDDQQGFIAGEDIMPGYGAYETYAWKPDEIVSVRQILHLPADLPSGRYWLQVGLYDPLTGRRAPSLDRTNRVRDDRVIVGPLKSPLRQEPAGGDMTPVHALMGTDVLLTGYLLTVENSQLRLQIDFQALRRPQRDYTVFVHLESSEGELIAQSDTQPLDGRYPTSIWDPGERVITTSELLLADGALRAGRPVRIWLGLYDWQTGVRLPITDTALLVDDDRLLIAEIP